jgi:hypothetical protein
MTALSLVLLAGALARAGEPTAEPRAVMVESERAKLVVERLKKYTDQFRSPAGDPFAPPPRIPLYSQREFEAPGFFNRADYWDFKSCLSSYRSLFDWWEEGDFDGAGVPGCYERGPRLDPERFQLAYGLATAGGSDKAAGARWVCGFAEALREYFIFYNELHGGEKGSFIAHNLWGVGTGPVDKMHELNGWISKRYKEASGIDLGLGEKNVLNYAVSERCAEAVQAEVAKLEEGERKKKILVPSVMHKPEPEQRYFKEDLSDADFANCDYWVFYYDASWQPWGVVAAQSKKWKNTPESFKKFVLCRAPLWAGNFVSCAPKNAKLQLRYFPKGGVSVRHPLQPSKASERKPALIEEHRRRYCR